MRPAWRIAADTPDYTADDLTGEGAKVTGGRWNRKGNPILYCAESVSLAVLETFVHIKSNGLPLNRYLVQIDIPKTLWQQATVLTEQTAPVGWDALPAGKVSLDAGDAWLVSGKSALLLVPSVIVPDEQNVLINPNHPDTKLIAATKIKRWDYDQRMF